LWDTWELSSSSSQSTTGIGCRTIAALVGPGGPNWHSESLAVPLETATVNTIMLSAGVLIRFENTPTVLPLTIAPGVSQSAETYLEPVIFELNPNVL